MVIFATVNALGGLRSSALADAARRRSCAAVHPVAGAGNRRRSADRRRAPARGRRPPTPSPTGGAHTDADAGTEHRAGHHRADTDGDAHDVSHIRRTGHRRQPQALTPPHAASAASARRRQSVDVARVVVEHASRGVARPVGAQRRANSLHPAARNAVLIALIEERDDLVLDDVEER